MISASSHSIGGMLVNDPTRVINTIHNGPTPSYNSIYEQILILEKENLYLKLRLLKLEGKYTEYEIDNIKNMLNSNDEASRVLAIEIINNG